MTRGKQVTVKAAAVVVVAADADGQRAVIRNAGSKTVYLGEAAVTSSTGFALPTGSVPIELELGPGEALYGRCGEGEETAVHALLTSAP